MPISPKPINDAEEYKDLVEKFSFLVEKEFEKCEKMKDGDILGVIQNLPKLISLVNTIGYLRGQDGAFLEARPHTDFQPDLYKNEDVFEAKLYKLIDFISSPEAKARYRQRLEEYFLKARKAE